MDTYLKPSPHREYMGELIADADSRDVWAHDGRVVISHGYAPSGSVR
jgi:hypothetical protein